jgi:rod shape-determining protein MreD
VKPLAHVLFALLVAAAQAALLRWVGGGWFSLSLLAGCVVYLSLHGGNVDGCVGAAGIGYVLDLMTGSPKGLMSFLAVLLFVVMRYVSTAVDVRGRGPFALLSGAGALFMSVGALVLTRMTSAPEAAPGIVLVPRMLLEAVLTGALSPVLLVGLRRIDALFHREEPGLLGRL